MDKLISAAILAGGAGRRFGGITKSNIVVGGRTIISRIMDAFPGLFSEIMIVTNIPSEFAGIKGVKMVPDIFHGVGPLGGIHAALTATTSEAVFIVAGDMPLVNRDLVVRQTGLFASLQPDALIPRSGRYIEPLHSIYNKKVLTRLEKFLDDGKSHAVWEFINILDAEYFEVEGDAEAANSFMSVNSPEDALFVEKIIAGRH